MKVKVNILPDKRTWHPSPLVGQIALVTTLNEDGQSNVAPKSWISMMAFEPPLIALGCHVEHWTARNILERRQFVLNMPGEEMAAVVWDSQIRPHPRSVEAVGLTPVRAQLVKPPLIEECRAHLECELERHIAFGNEIIFLGHILAGSLDREALERDDPYEYLRPIVFLEDNTYGVIERAHRLPG